MKVAHIAIIGAILLLAAFRFVSVYAQNFNEKDGKFEELIKNGALLLDVRTPQEFEEGHVEGSVNIPLGELEARLDELTDKKDEPIVVFCRSGKRSESALSILESNGFTNVTNGGGWVKIRELVEKQKNQ